MVKKYCTQCGTSVHAHSKFCTSCGNVMKPVENIPSSQAHTPAYVPEIIESPKKNFKPVLVIVPLILIFAGIIWYLSARDKNNFSPELAALNDTTAIISPPTMDRSAQLVSSTQTSYEDQTITAEETQRISEILQSFYSYDNNENIDELMEYFHFPVERYYANRDIDRASLYDLYTSSFTEKLYSHSIIIDWNQSSVVKKLYGYHVIAKAEYSYATLASPEDIRSRELSINIIMNENYEITSIYENK